MKKWLLMIVSVLYMTVYGATEANAVNIISYAVSGGNIYFDADNGTITGCDRSVTHVAIPSQINGVDVISIGDLAFSGCSNLLYRRLNTESPFA